MNTYLTLFILALCSSLVVTPVLRRICERYGWVDHPREHRRIHSRAIPNLGGVAIFISTVFALCSLIVLDNLVTQTLRPQWWKLLIVLVPATLLLLFGVYDDLRNSSPRLKLLAQTLVGILF